MTMEKDVPEQIDVYDLRDDNYRNFDILGMPTKSLSVTLWPDNRVITEIDISIQNNKDLSRRLACAMQYFHTETCIRFVERTRRDSDYLFITKSGAFCMTDSIGKRGGKQTVHLPTGCWKHGTIVHELMHVVGLFHEHQRNDRDKHIKVFKNKIPPFPPAIRHQFLKIKNMGYTGYKDIGVYDFSSIMHYGPKIGDKLVISAKIEKYEYNSFSLNEAMGNRRRPTANDTIKVNLRYGCDDTIRTSTQTPTTTPSFELPSHVDHRDSTGEVEDQSPCETGVCWAFAASHALTGVLHRAGYPLVDYSEQQLYDCVYNFDSCDTGGYSSDAYEYLMKKSFIKESNYKYTGMKGQCRSEGTRTKSLVTGWKHVSGCGMDGKSTCASEMKAVVAKHPVVVYLFIPDSFKTYKSRGLLR